MPRGESAHWASFADVRRSFNTADLVGTLIVFNIGGNKYRLVAEMNFRKKVLFIRQILTHGEYARSMEAMSTTATIDRKKYARLASRIPVKAIETEEEYDNMVAAVEQLMTGGKPLCLRKKLPYWKQWQFS